MLLEPQWDQLEPGGREWEGGDSHRKKPMAVQVDVSMGIKMGYQTEGWGDGVEAS